MRELQEAVDNCALKLTIRRLFREMHIKKWKQRNRPEIRPEHAAKRLKWAQRYANFTVEDQKRVKWTDECLVKRGQGARLIQTQNIPSQQLTKRDIHIVRYGKSIKQMFQAGFSYNIRIGLVLLDSDPNSARGGVTSAVIYNTYKAFLPELLQPNDIFMHNNALVYTARIMQRILNELGIKVMIWPPYLPDLNLIENLQALIKAIIYERYPELENAPDMVDTLERLVEAAKEAQHAINKRVLQSLALSMPHRVQAILTADGQYTQY